MRIRTAHLLTALATIWVASCSQQPGYWRVSILDKSGVQVGTLDITVPNASDPARETYRGNIKSTTGLADYPIGTEAEFTISNGRFFVDLNPEAHDNNTYLEGRISNADAEGEVILAIGPMGRSGGTFTATFVGAE